MALLTDEQIEHGLSGSQWRREGDAIERDLDLARGIDGLGVG